MLVPYRPLAPVSRSRFGSTARIASIAGGRRTLPDPPPEKVERLLSRQLEGDSASLERVASRLQAFGRHFRAQLIQQATGNIYFAADESQESSGTQLETLLTPFVKGDFKLMTVPELRKFCTSQGLRKVSKLKRAELLKLVAENQLQPPPLPPNKVIKKLKRTELESIVSYFVTNAL